jgi:glycosyltransferase involved in cell wall biosynthesis
LKQITVIIPCFNEEDAIAAVINKLPRVQLAERGFSLDVLVVDNNSTDKTAVRARRAGARVINEPKKGKGHAVKTGFYHVPADAEFVVMLDGDDTYQSEEILRLIEPIDSGFAKVIIGSRLLGRIKVGSMKNLNRFGNRLYSRLVRSVYRVSVTDVLTGYFAWDAEVIRKLRPHLKAGGFAIEMEMITKMARLGYEIFSVPVSYNPRLGSSSLRPVRDGARILNMYVNNLAWKPKNNGDLDITSPGIIRPKMVRPRINMTFYESLRKEDR